MKDKIYTNSTAGQYLGVLLSLIVVGFLLLPAAGLAADPSITATETVANSVTGTNDQTDVTVISPANLTETKASRTLTVGALPAAVESVTIGTCVVTFSSIVGATTDELNCSDNAAEIDRDTGAGDALRAAADIAGVLRTLTNLSDTGHGALAITGSGADAIFTTSGAETSATVVTFSDGTTGDITSAASVTGVVAVAQINTVTIGGTVDAGDVFTATLPTVGAVTYTVLSSDTTTANIATGLNAAILASSGYAAQAFTSAAVTNTVVLTAKAAGTGFTQTSAAVNAAAVAQKVVFAPVNLVSTWELTVTVNGTDYSHTQTSGDSTATVVSTLQTLVTADVAVTCTEDGTEITCTAVSAGTAFTYTTSVIAPPSVSSGSSSGGRVNLICKDEDATNYSTSRGRHKQSLCEFTTPVATQASDVAQDRASVHVLLAELISKNRAIILQAQEAGIILPPSIIALLGTPAPIKSTQKGPFFIPETDFARGESGNGVKSLQQFLNDNGFVVTETGPGSVGNETTFFGAGTQASLAAYQLANGIYPASGYFGPLTRAHMNASGR